MEDVQIDYIDQGSPGYTNLIAQITFITVTTSSNNNQNGLYLFSQEWAVLEGIGNPVNIDFTNAVNLSTTCPNSNYFWAFTTVTGGNIINKKNELVYYFIHCVTDGEGTSAEWEVLTPPADITGINFVII